MPAFPARPARRAAPRRHLVALGALAAACVPALAPAQAAPGSFVPDAALLRQVESVARGGASQLAGSGPAAALGVRVEVQVGQLDPRLRLAPCQTIQPYLPAGTPLWGASRVGLKCVKGPKAWNVSVPVTVHVYGKSTVVATNLAAGTVLVPGMLQVAEVDLAADRGAAVTRPDLAVGRTLSHPMAAGTPLRETDLKARQWFAAGETVRVVAGGPGWQVVTEAQAVSPGIEGQFVRVRMANGRLLTARPIGEREVELTL